MELEGIGLQVDSRPEPGKSEPEATSSGPHFANAAAAVTPWIYTRVCTYTVRCLQVDALRVDVRSSVWASERSGRGVCKAGEVVRPPLEQYWQRHGLVGGV